MGEREVFRRQGGLLFTRFTVGEEKETSPRVLFPVYTREEGLPWVLFPVYTREEGLPWWVFPGLYPERGPPMVGYSSCFMPERGLPGWVYTSCFMPERGLPGWFCTWFYARKRSPWVGGRRDTLHSPRVGRGAGTPPYMPPPASQVGVSCPVHTPYVHSRSHHPALVTRRYRQF